MTAEQVMTRSRTRLLLDQPWFGSLAMRLQMIPDSGVPTVETDGTKLVYNPEFVLARPEAEMLTIIAHEVMHTLRIAPSISARCAGS
jgi:predicted metal-dependent peptidase